MAIKEWWGIVASEAATLGSMGSAFGADSPAHSGVLPKPVPTWVFGWGVVNGAERHPTDLNVCQCVPLTCGFLRFRRSGGVADPC
jgi:hypothetical protein